MMIMRVMVIVNILFLISAKSSDIESMIGITLSPDGTYRNAHLKMMTALVIILLKNLLM